MVDAYDAAALLSRVYAFSVASIVEQNCTTITNSKKLDSDDWRTRFCKDESGDRRNVFSYCLKRLVLLIMIGDFQNGGNFPSVPTFPRFPVAKNATKGGRISIYTYASEGWAEAGFEK